MAAVIGLSQWLHNRCHILYSSGLSTTAIDSYCSSKVENLQRKRLLVMAFRDEK